ncbi:MAG: hypothetical protein AMS22_16100 [Thiotrichales bacterium SG8_50]|nr:MAG: hypothetical protein AMS22_16100 [Thiotrichales bacterium SG8_50]
MDASSRELQVYCTRPPIGVYRQPGGPNSLDTPSPIWAIRTYQDNWTQVLIKFLNRWYMWINVNPVHVGLHQKSED